MEIEEIALQIIDRDLLKYSNAFFLSFFVMLFHSITCDSIKR